MTAGKYTLAIGGTDAGIEMSIRIGQRVRHQDYQGQRVTGVVRGLSIDEDRALIAAVALDTPIVIPASGDGREIRLQWQNVPAHELAPFDEREELIAELVAALEAEQEWQARDAAGELDPDLDYETVVGAKRRAAIAKATGSAA